MRLLNVETFRLDEFFHEAVPPYAILSHTWGKDNEEVRFRDVVEGKCEKAGTRLIKLEGCCKQAKKDGYKYIWIDTCCIDNTNSVELQEAINSMFRWYRDASICYAYLSDVPADDNPRDPRSRFFSSRWFKRGWTLQELLAPQNLRLYNSEWRCLGTKGEMCAVIEKITDIPRQFLLGIAELRAASVAQRMSWAAKRVTKRKEDIAYCLLGIFGVTMPMIYGEGDKAFRRLQEQIMKEIRDDSILAWGLNLTKLASNHSTKVISQGILAAAPSDFTNCGQIVSREQSATATNSLDIFGSCLRLHLSIFTTSASETFGLLKCGPEHDTNQVVGIPLTTTTFREPSDEYIRPQGRYSVLLPKTTSKVSTKLIQIQIEHQSRILGATNQRYWFYIQESVETNLQLINVEPRSRWHKERALIETATESDGDIMQRTLARFRHKEEGSRDFVVVLEFETKRSQAQARCCLMISSRDTSLEDLARKFSYIRKEAFGKQSASNGILNLHVTLEPIPAQPMFVIRQDAIPSPPEVTFDATLELQQLDLNLEILSILEEEGQNALEEERLIQKIEEKSAGLEQLKKDLEVVKDELSKLEEKRRLLAKGLEDRNQEMDQLNVRHDEVRQRRLETQRRLNKLPDNNIVAKADPENGRKSEAEDDHTPLIWAAARGHEGVIRLLLDRGAEIESKSKSGQTPLSWAARKGHKAVVKLLLEKGAELETKSSDGRTPLSWAAGSGQEAVVKLLLEKGAELETKDKQYSRTPLSWAAWSGHEAVVKLLLEKGAELETKDKQYSQTPLSWAAEKGHEAVVKLLLEKGAELETKDNYNQTPLSWAARNGHEAVVKLLLEKGAEKPQ